MEPTTTQAEERKVTRASEGKQWPRVRMRCFFAVLGPGLITGAADDDPSGISTYSVTGAAFSDGALWTALFSLVDGCPPADVRTTRSRRRARAGHCGAPPLSALSVGGASVLLMVANVVNIGADLGGMAKAAEARDHRNETLTGCWSSSFAGRQGKWNLSPGHS